jgi:hypothetical protein
MQFIVSKPHVFEKQSLKLFFFFTIQSSCFSDQKNQEKKQKKTCAALVFMIFLVGKRFIFLH